ncbi:MAG TPA: DUF3422 domain-containing protein [Steroidobacter sp.]|uniref:DUF3422 family protein n=1 Tax=Steroidobacter sp. TaxID=1978227 RepID=UPI002ED7D434
MSSFASSRIESEKLASAPVVDRLALEPVSDLLSRREHPLRRALIEELHVRRFPSFSAPTRITQLVMYEGDDIAARSRQCAEALCARYGATSPPKGRYFSVRLRDIDFVWESHTEFTTWSFIKSGEFEHPFERPVLYELPHDWIESLPGQTIRATQVAVVGRATRLSSEQLQTFFNMEEAVCCDVLGWRARIWSNFRVHRDGFGRLLIHDRACASAGDTARLVQRLQELGNYRNMALLALPVAQSLSPELSKMETKLASLTREIAQGCADDEQLFHELSRLSAELARLIEDTRYRMSATRAYAQLVGDRLRDLRPRAVPGYQTLTDFTERRLTPAVRTCESFEQRLEDLSQRAAFSSSLIRTRIETTLAKQSRDLLVSMNQRTTLQLRLQQTVEGLSVLAISYYAIGILGYVSKALAHVVLVDVNLVLGIVAPMVVAAVWVGIRAVRRSWDPS